MLTFMLYRIPTQHTATTYGLLSMGVIYTTLYAAGHTRTHCQLLAAPNLTLAIVQMHVTIPHLPAFAQTSHIVETVMGNQPTVIYIIILKWATQTLRMTVGGSRSVRLVHIAPQASKGEVQKFLRVRLGSGSACGSSGICKSVRYTVNKRKGKVVEIRWSLLPRCVFVFLVMCCVVLTSILYRSIPSATVRCTIIILCLSSLC
jgi:hypothetical protein